MNKIIYFLLVSVLLFSCNSKTLYSDYKEIKKHKWKPSENILFLFDNIDTISKRNVFLNIRNNKNYQYSSIFLIAKIKFPKGTQITDTLEYAMTDNKGKWLGSGFTDSKENKLWYKENVIFTEKGTYTFTIANATRGFNDIEGTNPLQGITDVGLSIEIAK